MDTRFSDTKAEHLWRHARIGLAFVSPDGHWLRVNPYLSELLGYTEGELCSRTFQDVTHPDDTKADEEMVRYVMEGRIDRYAMTKRYLPKLGPPVWIRLHVSKVEDPKTGEFAFFFSQVAPVDPLIDAGLVNNPDRPVATVDDVALFLRKHWKLITGIGGAIAAAVAAWFKGH